MKRLIAVKNFLLVERLHRWDVVLSARLTASEGSSRQAQAARVAHWGDGPLVLVGLIVVYSLSWFFKAEALRQASFVALVGIAATAGVVTTIKYALRRQRPRDPAGFVTLSYDKYSFPSGHSARMAALGAAAAILHPLAGWSFGLLAMAVALARVVVGIHYVGDVLVGLIIGATVTGLVWGILG